MAASAPPRGIPGRPRHLPILTPRAKAFPLGEGGTAKPCRKRPLSRRVTIILHCLSASTSSRTPHHNVPASLAGTFQCVKKPRRVSPPQRRNRVRSFSAGACTWWKILLRLQVCELCALGAQGVRAADCSPFVGKARRGFRQALTSRPAWPGRFDSDRIRLTACTPVLRIRCR